ncbi:MAG: hypothetical protein QM648_02910 [Solirubrobacterales bacterium]
MADRQDKRAHDDEPDGIGGLVDELASTRLVGDALTRIVETGEKAFRAQQSALSALGLPSGSQFESLTLRVRTIFHRLEELEDEIDRLSARVAALEAKSAPKRGASRAPKTSRRAK